jgi:hypothetical protein
VQQVSYEPLIMNIMLIMSCYTGFFNVRRGWQSLNMGPRFYLRLIRRTLFCLYWWSLYWYLKVKKIIICISIYPMVFLPSSEATLNFVNYRKYFPDIQKKKKSKLHINLSTHFKNSYKNHIGRIWVDIGYSRMCLTMSNNFQKNNFREK